MSYRRLPLLFILILFFNYHYVDSRAEHLEEQKSHTTTTDAITTENNTVSILSWNLDNLGYSKSDNRIKFIAETVADYDILALQEIVGKNGGEDAVLRLAYKLDSLCTDCGWRYIVSLRTSGNTYQRERYAFLWKSSKVKSMDIGWLEPNFSEPIEREPFLSTFKLGEKQFTLVNFHALPKSKQPETEIKYFKYLPEIYSGLRLIFVGDFNVPETHTVFNPLKKMGYKSVLNGQKTTLRQNCVHDDCLASVYDNIFYPSENIELLQAGILHFYEDFDRDMIRARKISDHVPVVVEFRIK